MPHKSPKGSDHGSSDQVLLPNRNNHNGNIALCLHNLNVTLVSGKGSTYYDVLVSYEQIHGSALQILPIDNKRSATRQKPGLTFLSG